MDPSGHEELSSVAVIQFKSPPHWTGSQAEELQFNFLKQCFGFSCRRRADFMSCAFFDAAESAIAFSSRTCTLYSEQMTRFCRAASAGASVAVACRLPAAQGSVRGLWSLLALLPREDGCTCSADSQEAQLPSWLFLSPGGDGCGPHAHDFIVTLTAFGGFLTAPAPGVPG